MVDANHGWRMAGDRAPRWDVATAAQCARALERLGVYWLEEPLRTDDVEGYSLLRQRTTLRIAAGEMVRHLSEARDLILRGGVDVIQPDVVLAGGISGAAAASQGWPICAGARSHPTPGRTATGCSPTCTSRSPSRRARSWRCRSTRRPGRRSAATGSCPLRSRSRPTGRSRRPRAPASVSRPTSTRSRSSGSGDRMSAQQSSAGRAIAPRSRRSTLDRPAPGRGARADRGGRRVPLGPPLRGRAPGRRPLPDRPRARGGRNRRGRSAQASTHLAPGDPRRPLLPAGVRHVPALSRGPEHALRDDVEGDLRRDLARRVVPDPDARRRAAQALPRDRVLRRALRRPGGLSCADPRRAAALAGVRSSAAAVVTGLRSGPERGRGSRPARASASSAAAASGSRS